MMPMLGALVPLMVLFCGLALDTSMMELKRIRMQTAADAAAVGAEQEMERGTGEWSSMAMADAAINGYTNGSNGVTVTVFTSPTYGDYAGHNDAIQVTITQSVRTIFMGILTGGKTVSVNGYAASLVPPCGYFADVNGENDSGVAGTAALWVASASVWGTAYGNNYSPNCPIYANNAITNDYFSTLQSLQVNVTGAAGSSYVAGYTPAPVIYNVPRLTDPLAYIVQPVFQACTGGDSNLNLVNKTTTLSPGTYCGGLNMSGSTVTLNPGLYIITGGINWVNSTVTGTGVTLFFTKGGGSSYGSVQIVSISPGVGGCTVNLSASTTTAGGAIPYIVMFGDRNWVIQPLTGNHYTNGRDVGISFSTFTGDGIWYFTNTGIYVWEGSNVYGPNFLAMVVDSLYVYQATVYLSSSYTNYPSGNPFRTRAVLVQ